MDTLYGRSASAPAAPSADRPLAGIRVLELAHLIPGPMLTRTLADRGADVVKIEAPAGDPFRRFPPSAGGRGVLFEAANRGKRSVVLDLTTDDDRSTLRSLTEVADVIVDGYRTGVLERLGISWPELRERRPEVVICSISGFGQTGPLAALPAHGINIDAQSASIGVVGADGDYRYASDVSWGVEVGYLSGALATAVAALHAKATGQGVWLDVSCWDAAVEAHRLNLYSLLVGAPQHGLTERHAPMQSIYRTADGGFINLMATEQKFWTNFFRGVGRDDLVDRYRPRDYADPTEYPEDDEIRAYLHDLFLTATKQEWNDRFVTWGVAGGFLLTEAEVLAQPHFAARKIAGTTAATGLPYIADPIRYHELDSRPGEATAGAPALDADRCAVLADWLHIEGRTKETQCHDR